MNCLSLFQAKMQIFARTSVFTALAVFLPLSVNILWGRKKQPIKMSLGALRNQDGQVCFLKIYKQNNWENNQEINRSKKTVAVAQPHHAFICSPFTSIVQHHCQSLVMWSVYLQPSPLTISLSESKMKTSQWQAEAATGWHQSAAAGADWQQTCRKERMDSKRTLHWRK